MDIDDYLTLKQAAAQRGTSRQAVLSLIKRKRLDSKVVAGAHFIRPGDLARFKPQKRGPKKSGKNS